MEVHRWSVRIQTPLRRWGAALCHCLVCPAGAMWQRIDKKVHVVHTVPSPSGESGATTLAKVDQNRVPFWHGQFASSIRVCSQCAATAQSASGTGTKESEARYVPDGDVRPSAQLSRVLPG